MQSIAFFNNKGGVGKTSLAFHISWMLSELGHRVLSVDLDPQANLTGMFMLESELETLIDSKKSLYYALEPLIRGTGDIKDAEIFRPEAGEGALGLLPGDLKLSGMEEDFSSTWPKCLDGDERSFRLTAAFSRLIQRASKEMQADWTVIDMGPNLGAINRNVLISADYVIFPLGPDLFSWQGLKNTGEVLIQWRKEWKERKSKKPNGVDFALPEGNMSPLGYIIMRHSIRYDRPAKAYQRWIDKMPSAYREYVLSAKETGSTKDYMLGHIKDYRSLMPMAQEKRKPIFLLKPGDGAIGSHFQAAQICREDFKTLTEKILSEIKTGKGNTDCA